MHYHIIIYTVGRGRTEGKKGGARRKWKVDGGGVRLEKGEGGGFRCISAIQYACHPIL